MDSHPSVSVVIPTIRERFVQRAVSAALTQRGVSTDVIVIADGPEVADLENTLEKSERVRVVCRPKLQGVTNARNAGVELAAHDWIAFLDDDDIWAPDKLERQFEALGEQGGEFAYTAAAILDVDLNLVRYEVAPPYPELLDTLKANNLLPATASNLLVTRRLFDAIGGFDLGLKHFSDWDFALKLAREAPGAACAEPLVGYVHHDEGMHVQQVADVESEWANFQRTWADSGLELGSVDQIRWVAEGHQRRGHRRTAARLYVRAAREFGNKSDLARAVRALLGERVTRTAAFLQSRRAAPPGPAPEWVRRYRQGDGRAATGRAPDSASAPRSSPGGDSVSSDSESARPAVSPMTANKINSGTSGEIDRG